MVKLSLLLLKLSKRSEQRTQRGSNFFIRQSESSSKQSPIGSGRNRLVAFYVTFKSEFTQLKHCPSGFIFLKNRKIKERKRTSNCLQITELYSSNFCFDIPDVFW